MGQGRTLSVNREVKGLKEEEEDFGLGCEGSVMVFGRQGWRTQNNALPCPQIIDNV